MKILILGVGDAFTKLHFGSSALIETPDGFVLLDCPDPIHRVLHEATLAAGWTANVSRIDDIILTHLHGDHCNGLESFGFLRNIMRQHDTSLTTPRLHATRPVAERLWQRLSPAMDGAPSHDPPRTLDTFYDLRILDPGAASRIAGLTVQCRFTGHPIPTVGLRISDGASTFGWSGDTPFEQAHIDWLADADLIVHESNRGAAHTPIESLNALPDGLRRKMRLIHLPDDFDGRTTDILPLQPRELLEV